MARKVTLDALIQREDFEADAADRHSSGRNTATMTINDLKHGSFFFEAIRKPDFQRETNQWEAKTVVDLVQSFLDGDLVPALILWRRHNGYTFVIDGAHRISALAAWINDDYGDGIISTRFYEGQIPPDQIAVAEATRKLMKRSVGAFKDFELATSNPDKVKPDIAARARGLGTLALQLQWAEGDAKKAEQSFIKINRQGEPIDRTELKLIESRGEPFAIASRAIIRSGKGHKYWSGTEIECQDEIQQVSKEINSILFNPSVKLPVKTLDVPIAGPIAASQSLALVVDFVKIANNLPTIEATIENAGAAGEAATEHRNIGQETLSLLHGSRQVARLINSNSPTSLGLHPIVYFYSETGRHKIASFFAISALVKDYEMRRLLAKFTKVRAQFEDLLLNYEYLTQQIVRRYRSAGASYGFVRKFYALCIDRLNDGVTVEEFVEEANKHESFGYLTFMTESNAAPQQAGFSGDTKAAVYIKEALAGALRCKICQGYLHLNAIHHDHKIRLADGGTSDSSNAQLTHPYCNTTIKH